MIMAKLVVIMAKNSCVGKSKGACGDCGDDEGEMIELRGVAWNTLCAEACHGLRELIQSMTLGVDEVESGGGRAARHNNCGGNSGEERRVSMLRRCRSSSCFGLIAWSQRKANR